nr:hypothetical protein [Tanacetum cinerariifolium]
HPQRLRAINGKTAARQRGIEQHDDGTVVRGRCGHAACGLPRQLRDVLGHDLRRQYLALQQRARRQLAGVDAGQAVGDRFLKFLHADRQGIGRPLGNVDVSAGRQRQGAADGQGGLLAVVHGQPEQQLEILAKLLEADHFSVGDLTRIHKARARLHELEHFARRNAC